VPAGIDITGAPHDLTFISNRVHNIANLNPSSNANAYGIAVHGTLPQAISNLVFRGNEIYSNTWGKVKPFRWTATATASRSAAISSMTTTTSASVSSVTKGVCSDPPQDYTRNGVCRSNLVWNISDAANPSLPGQ
jgi:hypothetical protein